VKHAVWSKSWLASLIMSSPGSLDVTTNSLLKIFEGFSARYQELLAWTISSGPEFGGVIAK